jgi:hypothetical protein
LPSATRESVGHHLLELLEADYYASFVWQDAAGRFDNAVFLNMDAKNLANYDIYISITIPLPSSFRPAVTLGVEVSTIRTHLKRNFAKLGVHRRSGVAGLLAKHR